MTKITAENLPPMTTTLYNLIRACKSVKILNLLSGSVRDVECEIVLNGNVAILSDSGYMKLLHPGCTYMKKNEGDVRIADSRHRKLFIFNS